MCLAQRELHEGNEYLRLGIDSESIVSHVTHYPNDLQISEHGHVQRSPDWAPVPEVPVCHRRIDERHPSGLGTIQSID